MSRYKHSYLCISDWLYTQDMDIHISRLYLLVKYKPSNLSISSELYGRIWADINSHILCISDWLYAQDMDIHISRLYLLVKYKHSYLSISSGLYRRIWADINAHILCISDWLYTQDISIHMHIWFISAQLYAQDMNKIWTFVSVKITSLKSYLVYICPIICTRYEQIWTFVSVKITSSYINKI